MPLSTNFNVTPYYDDYDENSNYYRILFRPGYAVQAREVTQLQTILQKQIERYGQHMFRDGSKVLGGEVTLDTDVKSLKLETQESGVNINAASFTGTTIIGATSNARARIVASQAATSSTQPTLMFHYLSGDTFDDGETIAAGAVQATVVSAAGASGITGATGNGSVVSVDTGVFYVGGFFLFTPANTIILDAYSETPSGRIGLEITESTKTSDDDNTLLDPASGTYNYAAPGAARYKIELSLKNKALTSSDPVFQLADENFIQLLKVINGVKKEEVKYPMYGELEKTLARRTYDESGDYTITPFNLDLKVHRGISGTTAASGVDGTTVHGDNTLFETELSVGDEIYLGSNTTTSTITAIANNTRLTVQTTLPTNTGGAIIYNESEINVGLDAGKAYVKGYEYESIDTQYLDVDKGRDTEEVTGYSMTSEVGNYLVVDTVSSLFDVGASEVCQMHSVPFSSINLTNNTTYAATEVGTARVRSMDWDTSSGNTDNADTNHSNYRLYLWDVNTSNNITGTVGQQELANTRIINLDADTTSFVNGAYTGATITVNTTSGIDTTSDVRVIDDYYSDVNYIEGESSTSGMSAGDSILNEDGTTVLLQDSGHYVVANSVLSQATQANTTYDIDFKIKDVESITTATLGAPPTINTHADIADGGKYNSSGSGNTILSSTDKNTLVFPLPQSPIKETTTTGNTVSYSFKKVEKALSSTSTGKLSITLSNPNYRFMPSGGTLSTTNAKENFIVVVKTPNSAQTFINAVSSSATIPSASATEARTLIQGDYLDLAAVNDAGASIRPVEINVSRGTVDIYCNTNATFVADVIYTVESSSVKKEPGPRTKTLVSGNGSSIVATTGTPAVPTNSTASGQFYFETPNQTQTGTDSIPVSDAFNLVKVVDSGQPFVHVTVAMMTATANNITDRYTFESGQKDNFYDHATIKLKPGQPGPAGKIMVVVDYFDWDGGEGYHSVDSYPSSGSYNRVDVASTKTFSYGTIPDFTSPTTGETVNLRDCIDFRPRRENADNDMSATLAIEGIPTPDPDGTITSTFSYYLSRIDKIVLTKDRKFKVLRGESALNPIAPPDDEDSMTLYSLSLPAYTFNLSDITTRYVDNKRFTMRDIGKLEKRIERIEYYTALTILEKETASREFSTSAAKDSLFNPTGTSFKNGILVDSFSGHSVGDVMNDDYNISVEYAKKEMRPGFYYDNHRFTYSLAYSNNVTKTGDLVTLPYVNTDFIAQPLSSSTQSLNPFNITNWMGKITTFPASDTWFSQGVRPDVTTNLESQNDNWALSPSSGRKGFGSQYDDWSTNWTGKQVTEQPQAGVDKTGKTGKSNRSTAEMNDSKSRVGISANTPPESVLKSIGNKVVDTTVVPYVRGQTVFFAATGLQPLTNVYVYFSETDVSAYIRPASKLSLISVNGNFQVGETMKDAANNYGTVMLTSNTYNNTATVFISNVTGNTAATDSAPYASANGLSEGQRESFGTGTIGDDTHVFTVANNVEGITSTATANVSARVHYGTGVANGIMQTDDKGQIAGEFHLPDATWRSGNKLLRITDSALNNVDATVTASESTFITKGILQNREQLLISTRESINQRELPNDTAIVRDTTSRTTEKTAWVNPLCQTFHVDPNAFPKGLFLRNVTLHFYSKDTVLPVKLQLRPVVNGFPSASKVIPFSEVTLTPDRVQASTIANSAVANTTTKTTFTFDSPVYLTPDEYAIVLTSNSTEYVLHMAEEGKTSTGSIAKISKPVFVGSYYKPQNAGVWEADPNKYIMFNAQRADFTIGAGGDTNFAKFITCANAATGNTANVEADIIKVGTSTIDFSDTEIQWKYAASNGTFTLADGTEGSAAYVKFSPDQNYELTDRKRVVATTNGSFRVRAEMKSSNSHVSPVIDLDRMNLISVENLVDNGGLANADMSITTKGSGYVNVMSSAYTATITSGGTTNSATANVHVELTMNVNSNSTTISSANGGYTVDSSNPGAFVVGEAVMCNVASDVNANNSGVYGIVSAVTHLEGNTSKNVSSVTIKTNANNKTIATSGAGAFTNGCLIWANPNAQTNAVSGAGGSNTKMTVLVANGYVSNVVIVDTGSGYTQNPTVTMSTVTGAGSINTAVQCTGEERNSGGPISAKYISRRVTLKDGFDASDIKVIVNAYKPLGTDVHVYYKVKNSDDPEDFDLKNYTLMTQETSAGTISKGKDDIKEFIYQTPADTAAYTSNSIRYETFKVFSVKIALVADTTYDMPRVKDMRAIAID